MKFFILEPTGNSSWELFSTFTRTFEELGHSFVLDAADCDAVLYDLWNFGGVYSRRDVDKVLFWKKPVVGFDFKDQWGSPEHKPKWWGFDGNLILETKASEDERWAVHLKQFIDAGLLRLMFVRKMSKSWEYPNWTRPIEVAVWPDHDFTAQPFSQFEMRNFDAAFIGNATPWRANAAWSLARHLNCDFFFPLHRLEHDDWLSRHRDSLMYLEADGGGFGSERPQQLTCVAVQLRIRNDHRMAFPWTDGVNCLEVGDQWGLVTEDECDRLKTELGDLENMYRIYLSGIDFLRMNYSTEARARYVLEQMATVGLQ